ncbi:hypothetical protein CC85DRAFT_324795 [Cutaneotrichosporon oleaginosum]|uniref:Uncharacterized protein n=1 Tax=Cutaneotrichosporon oleaginosum TaxID=879819 RepID=A0A0J0XZL9_9TREE|nr:uncharacterized protein CC85DRAFT_324795 [Cutaneotrichosporon oleaginosum]KLT46480.1 hypothetical protein CC85DRAFT_324795 [Cutaneotrichosporon oleaginosum]TXT15153.1 hypothetical protein COLE_01346 [Cutaneotrichosporon oleaginosum]
MKSDSVGADAYSLPAPPPLPGDDADHLNHTLQPHLTLTHRPAPRRLPQRGVTPSFSIESYYLSFLFDSSPSLASSLPHLTPCLTLTSGPSTPAAQLEFVEEGGHAATRSPLPSQSTTRFCSPGLHESPGLVTASECAVTNATVGEARESMLPSVLPSLPVEPDDMKAMEIDPSAQDARSHPSAELDSDVTVHSKPPPAPSLCVHNIMPDSPPTMPPCHAPVCDAVDLAPSLHPKPRSTLGDFRPPKLVTPEDTQWCAGKARRHHGPTQKRRADSSSDAARELHDLEVAASRVLKRPFKPPTVVNLPAVRLRPSQQTQPATKQLSRPTRRLAKTTRIKPFIPPTMAAHGSSTVSRPGSFSKTRVSRGRATDLNRNLISSLEERLRQLHKAIHLEHTGEDVVIQGRIHTWRQAGRDVTDLLFALIPEPPDDTAPHLPLSRWDDWGFSNDSNSAGLSSRQLEYLRNAPTNANGDVLDERGDPIFGDYSDPGSFTDQVTGTDAYIPAYEAHSMEHKPAKTDRVWDKSAMLQRFSVDPGLLGWDREAEDWTEIPEWEG